MKIEPLVVDLAPTYISFEFQATKADGTVYDPTGTPTLSIYEEGGADGTYDNSQVAGSPFNMAQINSKTGNYGVLVAKSLFTAGKLYRCIYSAVVDSITTGKVEIFQACNASQFKATGFSTFNPASDTVAHVTLVDTSTNLTNLPAVTTDWLTAAGVKADAVTKIQAGLASQTSVNKIMAIRTCTITDLSPTTTKFQTSLTETGTYWARSVIEFIGGTNDGVIRQIKTYNGTTKEIQLETPLPSAPSTGDAFNIVMARNFVTIAIDQSVIDSIWAEPLASMITVDTIGKKLADWIIGTDNKNLISTDAQDLSTTLKVDAKVVEDKTGYSGTATNMVTDVSGNVTTILNAIQNATYGLSALETLLADIDTSTELAARFTEIKGAGWTIETLKAIYDKVLLAAVPTGLYQITVQIYETATTTGIATYNLSVYDSTNTVFQKNAVTNGSGIAIITLDAGTYKVRGSKVGYTAVNVTETLVVTADGSVTYYADPFVIPVPSSADSVTIYEWVKKQDGINFPTTVKATATIDSLPYDYDGSLMSGIAVDGTYDNTTGFLSWTIVKGATVHFSIPALGYDKFKVIPTTSTRLADL